MVKQPSVIGVIQARMSSSRLPGKILAPIVAEKPLIAVLVERIRPAGIPLWLVTSTERTDDVTAYWGEALGLNVLRGSRDDVLSRFAAVCAKTNPDWVVRFTADDPFTDAWITREVIRVAQSANASIDLVTSTSQFPLGYVPQLVRGSAITRLDATLSPPPNRDREHVTTALLDAALSLPPIPGLPNRPGHRWTVDTPSDLEMARAVFADLGGRSATATYTDLVDWLDRNPDIARHNRRD